LEQELDRLLTWVSAAESRLAYTLPLGTAMLGSLAVMAPDATNWQTSEAIWTALATLGLAISLIACWLAIAPRTHGPKGSLIYFGTITDKDKEQYAAAVRSMTQQDYIDDLVTQCHRNADIAKTKYFWIKIAMSSLLASSLPWALALHCLYT